MTCIYAEITKSGRLRCTYNNTRNNSVTEEENNSSSVTSNIESSFNSNISSNSQTSSNIKMCLYQAYCQKRYQWELRGQNKCKYYEQG